MDAENEMYLLLQGGDNIFFSFSKRQVNVVTKMCNGCWFQCFRMILNHCIWNKFHNKILKVYILIFEADILKAFYFVVVFNAVAIGIEIETYDLWNLILFLYMTGKKWNAYLFSLVMLIFFSYQLNKYMQSINLLN